MFGDIFLTYWDGLVIVLVLLFFNIIHNLFVMANIKRKAGKKSKYSKQKFIKRFFLVNNSNIPNKTFVIMTYLNYVVFALLAISYICHIVIYNQITSTILQIFGYFALVTLILMMIVEDK